VSSYNFNFLFFVLLITGFWLLVRQKPLFGTMQLTIVVVYLLILWITRPRGVDDGIVLLRYTIVGILSGLLAVAYALDRVYLKIKEITGSKKLLPIAGLPLSAAFFVLFFIKGPIPETYAVPNNFTNHSAFQGSYESHTWARSDARHTYPSFIATKESIPDFYPWLAQQEYADKIIEYPFDICNFNDLYYYYQHFHRKQVIVGYCRDRRYAGFTYMEKREGKKSSDATNFSIGALCVDNILARIRNPEKIAFRNMIDLDDLSAVARSGAEFIVLHKYYQALKIRPDGMATIPIHFRGVDHFFEKYRNAMGLPIYEDDQIVCFQIKRTEKSP
jgi:hypothetical protein